MTDETKEYLHSLFSDVDGWHNDTWREWSAKHPINYHVQYDLHCPPWWVPISECWFFWDDPHPQVGNCLHNDWNKARAFYWNLFCGYRDALKAQGLEPAEWECDEYETAILICSHRAEPKRKESVHAGG